MARRGVMNALQAALAGISGAAGGYVQMEELKRKRLQEEEDRKRRQALDEAGIRSEQREIARMGGTQIAGMGEQVAGPVPSAIPLSGVGNAFAAAEQAGGPATSRGALRQTAGGATFIIPPEIERATLEREAIKGFAAEDQQEVNRRNYATFRELGGKGEYKPGVNYDKMISDLAGRRQQGAGETSENKLRETFLTKYFSEYGEMPQRAQVDEFVRLARGGRTIDDLFPAGETPTPRQAETPAMPSMTTPAGGMFARGMFTSPVGATQPSSQEEIRTLAARLAELNRGGRGTIAAREQYERNAPERARIQAALDEAQRRYRASR